MSNQKSYVFDVNNEIEHIRKYLSHQRSLKGEKMPEGKQFSAFSEWMENSTDTRYFIHVTKYANYCSIKSKGILVNKEKEGQEKIYCVKKYSHSVESNEALVLFIDTDGLEKVDSGYTAVEYFILESIDPERIIGSIAYDLCSYEELSLPECP